MHSDTAVYVCIFKRNDTEPFYELELHKTMGIVYSIFITGINIDDCFYCFKENEEYIVDPYAKAVTECEIFGIEKKDNIQVQLSLLITTGKMTDSCIFLMMNVLCTSLM